MNRFIVDTMWTFHDSVIETLMPVEWLEVRAWYYRLHGLWNNNTVWSDSQLKYLTSAENNDELISGFTLRSHSTTQVSGEQQNLRTPWQIIHQCDITSLAVSTYMNDGVLYYFMHWAISSDMSFVRILLDKTTISWWVLLIALVYQCPELLVITTPPKSVTIYSPTWHLG